MQADGCRKGNGCDHCHLCTAAEVKKRVNRVLATPVMKSPSDLGTKVTSRKVKYFVGFQPPKFYEKFDYQGIIEACNT